MKIKINREALNIVKDYENVTIEYSNGGDTYRLSNGDLLTRNEIKKLADINQVDEVLEQIKAKENGCEYVDESGNYITAEEYHRLGAEFDDVEYEYEKIEWEEELNHEALVKLFNELNLEYREALVNEYVTENLGSDNVTYYWYADGDGYEAAVTESGEVVDLDYLHEVMGV